MGDKPVFGRGAALVAKGLAVLALLGAGPVAAFGPGAVAGASGSATVAAPVGATVVAGAAHPGRSTPIVEPLGERAAPAAPRVSHQPAVAPVAPLTTGSQTIVVDTTADETPATATCGAGNHTTCTLRDAVATADTDTSAVDVIDVPKGTYTLTPSLGPLVVTTSMHLVGTAAAATVVVSGARATQILSVAGTAVTVTDAGTTVTVRSEPDLLLGSLTLRDGNADGDHETSSSGGDLALWAGAAELEGVTLSGGEAEQGGDVYVAYDSDLWADAATVVSTGSATQDGGGIAVQGEPTPTGTPPVPVKGGSVMLAGTTLRADHAIKGGGLFDDGTVTATTVTYIGDGAEQGGAVFNTQEFTDTGGSYVADTAGGGATTFVGGAAVFNVNQATVAGATVSTAAVTTATREAEGGVFYNSRAMSLTGDTVRTTTLACTTSAVTGGVVANSTWPYAPDSSTRPELVVTGLVVSTTTVGAVGLTGCRISGGVLANLAEATVDGLAVAETTLHAGDTAVTGGVVFDGPDATSAATLTLSASTVSATTVAMTGSAPLYGGALDLATNHDTVVLRDDQVSTTSVRVGDATVHGGAVDEDTDGGITDVSISTTSVEGSGATVFGGALLTTGHLQVDGLQVRGTTVADTTAPTGKVHGGAWFETTVVSAQDVELLTTSVRASKSITGGALVVNDAAAIEDSTIARATATVTTGGRAVYGALATLEGKQISLVNVTMDDSTATVPSGDFASALNIGTSVQFTNDTIAGDRVHAASGSLGAPSGGIVVFHTAQATLENTIVDVATVPDCALTESTGNELAVVESAGGNVETGDSCAMAQATDLVTTDPLVTPVATNGGPVETAALLAGSPAVGHGVAAGAPSTDARGVPRPASDIDSGAFQVAAQGYDEVGADGSIYHFGTGPSDGSMAGVALSAPIVGMALTPTDGGYWEVAADGGVFTLGTAAYYGSMAGRVLDAPVVGMAATPTGKGYWLVAADGGVFSFGTAAFYGSTGAMTLNAPVVGMAAAPTGGGYWEVAADGGVFAWGAAGFHGSMGAQALNAPVVGMAAAPTGGGYWEVAADGGVFAWGAAGFLGTAVTAPPSAPVVGGAAVAVL